jgi:hypothetical protein
MSGRRRLERLQGLAFDVVLVAVAVAVSEDAVQAWLMEHPPFLYHGLAALHVVACPALLVASAMGYGKTGDLAEINRPGPGPLGWAGALLFGGSFVIPGVLGLLFRMPEWEYMATIFAPVVVVLPLWFWLLIVAERRGWIAPATLGTPKPWWRVQALALLGWCYLVWLETMLLVAARHEGPLVEVGLPVGVLIDYLPVRVVLYYVRDSPRWEVWTITASVLHLLYRIVSAG